MHGIQRGFLHDPLSRDQLSAMAITANMTGFQFSSTKDVVKYEMEADLTQMDCYVAPTIINLENPTFWVNQAKINIPRPL